MSDEDIAKLTKIINDCDKSGGDLRVCWVTSEPTRNDGFSAARRYMPVYRTVTAVTEIADEPVATLGDAHGGYVALWACQSDEFVLVTSLFSATVWT